MPLIGQFWGVNGMLSGVGPQGRSLSAARGSRSVQSERVYRQSGHSLYPLPGAGEKPEKRKIAY